jgi:hypothetical protein
MPDSLSEFPIEFFENSVRMVPNSVNALQETAPAGDVDAIGTLPLSAAAAGFGNTGEP